jgi:hypothetical protein
MRRLAFGFAFLWLACAFGIRLHDMRKPQINISAFTGGQRGERATLAWLQGTLAWRKQKQFGQLVVVDVRVDGKIERYATKSLPQDWLDCRLWLEEGPSTVQAVASCSGHEPVRLTAAGTSLPGLGPDGKPPLLRELGPLTSVEPDRVITQIHRRDTAPPHPMLLVLGLLAMAPLGLLAVRSLRLSRRLRGEPVLDGVLEQTDKGAFTIRSGERRVTVYTEQGEVLSVGLGRAAKSGDTMAVEGLRAAVQGQVERQFDGAYRGGESMRLGLGAVLVVGDGLAEARRRLGIDAALNLGLALSGVILSAIVAIGMGW